MGVVGHGMMISEVGQFFSNYAYQYKFEQFFINSATEPQEKMDYFQNGIDIGVAAACGYGLKYGKFFH